MKSRFILHWRVCLRLQNLLICKYESPLELDPMFSLVNRSCELLSMLLEQLELEVAALHSFKSQSLRLSALHKFKSGRVPVLLATDVANRGLDIPTVDLVINYDIPR